MSLFRTNALSFATATALFIAVIALVLDLKNLRTAITDSLKGDLKSLTPISSYDCLAHQYDIEIVSLDPLLIYIRNFLSRDDITGLLEAGENQFNPSEVYKHGNLIKNTWYAWEIMTLELFIHY